MNLLKPKKTTFNARALVYRRITGLEKARGYLVAYKCLKVDNVTYDYFLFDYDKQEFIEFNINDAIPTSEVVVTSSTQVFQSGSNYFYWDKVQNKWLKTNTLPSGSTLASAGYSNIAKYQTNKYVYVGSIDYVITGSIEGTRTQIIKGAIMHLTSMNIKYYDDSLLLDEEDLVVIDGRLYSVESPDCTIKHTPRPYKIYSVTLNSIL